MAGAKELIGSLVKGRFDHQIADLVGRRRASNRSVAFDDQRLAAGMGEERRSGLSAEARPDDDDVVSLRHLMCRQAEGWVKPWRVGLNVNRGRKPL